MGCGAVERQGAGKGIKQKNEDNKPNQTISDKLCRYMKHIYVWKIIFIEVPNR